MTDNTNLAPAPYKGDLYEEGNNVVSYKDMELSGDAYQVFLVNVTVNGEFLTRETAAKYLNNVNWFQALQVQE